MQSGIRGEARCKSQIQFSCSDQHGAIIVIPMGDRMPYSHQRAFELLQLRRDTMSRVMLQMRIRINEAFCLVSDMLRNCSPGFSGVPRQDHVIR